MWSSLAHLLSSWWSFHLYYDGLRVVEVGMDLQARGVVAAAWVRGLGGEGLGGARRGGGGLQLPPFPLAGLVAWPLLFYPSEADPYRLKLIGHRVMSRVPIW